MKKTVLLFASFIFSAGVWAQTPGGAAPTTPHGNAKISGTVMDADDNTPVEFANVALLDPATGKPVDGSVCDDKGGFSINKVAEGTYNVAVSFIGYETQTISNIKIDKKSDVNLGVIKLSTGAKVLNEVVVEGQKQMVEERVDRTIYNAENDATTRGGDATDVLKRVPMLSVDMDGNVTLRGSSNIKVLINNKPSTIMASSIADALKQIPADQIKTVEVITSPSAKYDAEGSGGIINIVLKKNTLQGATLNVDTGVGLRGSNLGLNGSYRKGKMGFNLGGFGRAMYNVTGSFDNTQITKTPEGAVISTNQQTAATRSHGLFGNYTLGWDYDIDKKNSLAASVRFGARNNNSYQDNLFLLATKPNDTDSTSLAQVYTKDLSNTIDMNLSYTHLYDKPQRELSFLALYSKNNRTNNFDRRVDEINYVPDPSGTRNLNDSYNQEITFQGDYQTPISTNQMLEVGAKDIMRKVYSNYTYYSDQDGDGIYELATNAQLSNNLNYDQNIASGYLSYTLSTKSGYSFKAGSRYEYTTISAHTKEGNIDIPSYGVLVPSVNLSRKLKNGGMVKASYNRRIQRPSIQYLNPNIQSGNPLSITQGNPTLNPEYTNNYELGYNTYIGGSSLNFTSFVRNTTGSIQSVRTPGEDKGYAAGSIYTTYENIGTENAYGLSVFANVNIGKLSLNGGSDIYYAVLDNHVDTRNEGWVASGRLFGSYNLTKGWGFQFFSFYRGRQVQLQGSQGGFGIYSLGLKKDFNEKKGSIGFGAENFFTPNFRIHNNIQSPTIDQRSLNIMHTMSFRITFSYRIGKMSVDAPKRRKSINNDDLKEGGDNGGGQDTGGAQGGGQRGGGQRSGGFTPGAGAATGAAATKAPALPPADATKTVDATGTWNYKVESPQGGEGTIVISKEGDKYTGTITSRRGTSQLSDVNMNGNELTFHYDFNTPNGAMTMQVKSIIEDSKMTGNITVGQFGTFPLNATKVN